MSDQLDARTLNAALTRLAQETIDDAGAGTVDQAHDEAYSPAFAEASQYYAARYAYADARRWHNPRGEAAHAHRAYDSVPPLLECALFIGPDVLPAEYGARLDAELCDLAANVLEYAQSQLTALLQRALEHRS